MTENLWHCNDCDLKDWPTFAGTLNISIDDESLLALSIALHLSINHQNFESIKGFEHERGNPIFDELIIAIRREEEIKSNP